MSATAGAPTVVPAVKSGPPRWFLWGLVLLGLLGLGIRLVNVTVWRPTCDEDLVAIAQSGRLDALDPQPPDCFAVRGDAMYSYYQGYWIGNGHWFVDSSDFLFDGGDLSQPGAGDPPLYALVLGAVTALGGSDPAAHRVASAVIGSTVVVLAGLAGRRLAGARAGLVAAAFAAVHPMLWINDGMLMSEALYAPLVALTILAAYHLWDRPSWRAALLAGLAIGTAALTRAEAAALVPFVVVPLVWGLHRRGMVDGRAAVAWVGVAGGTVAVMLAPWVAWNLTRFEHPVTLTSGTGTVLSAGACDPEFSGEYLGFWGNCYTLHVQEGLADPPPEGNDADESEIDLLRREGALAYLSEHADRLPVVVPARIGRVWDLYAPGQMAWLNGVVEGRDRWASDAGVRLHLGLVLPAGVAGAVVLWRRRLPVSPFIALAVTVTLIAGATFGLTRYRLPADVGLVILVGVALDALARRRWPATDGGSVRPKDAARPALGDDAASTGRGDPAVAVTT